ncbi:hypothetical protein BRC77_08495 [Halobacteriales archaeon QH_8_64_26]|nr:MAG: hypothetical protein BRC77_08495 [Halobacteriales archaeon QH_8_64_26]
MAFSTDLGEATSAVTSAVRLFPSTNGCSAASNRTRRAPFCEPFPAPARSTPSPDVGECRGHRFRGTDARVGPSIAGHDVGADSEYVLAGRILRIVGYARLTPQPRSSG